MLSAEASVFMALGAQTHIRERSGDSLMSYNGTNMNGVGASEGGAQT